MRSTLQAPTLSDGDTRFREMVTRLHPSQLQAGQVALSENGRMDVEGVWRPREGFENVSGVTLTTTAAAILAGEGEDGAIMLIGAQSGATAAATSNVVTVTTASAHGLPSGHTSTINLAGFTAAGSGADINGNREVTRASDTTFTFALTSADDTYASGTVGAVKLSGDAIAIRGACLFSDPNDSNADYIVIADNTQATAIKVSDLSKTTIAYPSGESLGQECDLIQEFDEVVLRQKGKTSWRFDPDDGSNGLGATPAFVKFDTGAATQHKIFTAANNTVISGGVVTVSETGHEQSVGGKIRVTDAGSTGLLTDRDYEIATVPDANSFTFYTDADDATSTSVVYTTKASLGGGFVNPPAAPWGIYHQRRSWLPWNYDSESSPAHRGVEDEGIASDILSHVYDPISNQYRFSGGRADHLVAYHGYDADRILVFMRNSIHYISGVSGALTDTAVNQLTDRIGCVARKSVAQTPDNQVLFLADNGVYAITFLDELNLRGTNLPLSEPVESIIRRITPGAADKAIGIYHDDRYWLTVPLDGASEPNHFLLYNFLNPGWESLDSVNSSGWAVQELVQARAGKINELYAVTTYGGVHRLDNTGRDQDKIAAAVGQSEDAVLDVPAALTTRALTFGDLRRKKFSRLRMQIDADADYLAQGDVSVLVQDPDRTVAMPAVRDVFSGGLPAGQSGTYHRRIGNPRGANAQVKFTPESGRPGIRSVQVDAVGSFESTTAAK